MTTHPQGHPVPYLYLGKLPLLPTSTADPTRQLHSVGGVSDRPALHAIHDHFGVDSWRGDSDFEPQPVLSQVWGMAQVEVSMS